MRSWVRNPPETWMSVCCECCVLSGRGLCVDLITRPEESYRMCCVVVCDLETSWMRRPWPALGRSATRKKMKPKLVMYLTRMWQKKVTFTSDFRELQDFYFHFLKCTFACYWLLKPICRYKNLKATSLACGCTKDTSLSYLEVHCQASDAQMPEALSETCAVIKVAFLDEEKHLTYPFLEPK